MLKYFFNHRTLMLLFSTVSLVNLVSCANPESTNVSEQKSDLALVSPVLSATETLKETVSPKVAPSPSQKTQTPQTINHYQDAIDLATGAITISKSAVSRDDWSLAANHWQRAINSLKSVPSSHPKYKLARKKLNEYPAYLAEAKLRATPSPKKPCSGDTNPAFFSVPIKGKLGGIPIVEVTFDDNHKFEMLFDTGASKTLITSSMAESLKLIPEKLGAAQLADGSISIFPIAQVKSQEINGRFRMEVPVGIAPPEMRIGLLGQDFYQGYDIAIKENVIEFRRRSSTASVTRKKTACLVDTHPKSFKAPILRREEGIPVIAVTFNDKHTFPMMFDTGATGTVITPAMAEKMDLKLLGIKAVRVADGARVPFGVTVVKSQKIANRIKRDMEVSVTPQAVDMGLLGQDFLEGYNYTIKNNIIEFYRQEP
jgi:predicted aspartyl protease